MKNQATEQIQWDDKYRGASLAKAVEGVKQASSIRIIRILGELAKVGDRVLEAGSGSGRLSLHLADTFKIKTTGLDFSPEGNQLAIRTRDALRCPANFVEADLTRMPFGDGSFDIVFSDSVIEHVERTDKAVCEMARVVKAGGFVVITTPNKLRPDGWDLYKLRNKPPYLQKSFTPRQLKRLFSTCGMSVEQIFGDTLVLLRNFRRRGAQRPKTQGSSTVLRSAGRRFLKLERAAEGFWPESLWVNIGVVAKKI